MRVVIEVRSDRIPGIAGAMRGYAEAAVAKCVFDIEGLAKQKAPIDTGNLRNSILGEVDGLTGTVSTGVEYAAYQEYGTYKMAAHPYMVPAAEAVAPAFIAEMSHVADG